MHLNNQRMGQGKQTYASGKIHEGSFVNGYLHGKGKITREISIYEGDV